METFEELRLHSRNETLSCSVCMTNEYSYRPSLTHSCSGEKTRVYPGAVVDHIERRQCEDSGGTKVREVHFCSNLREWGAETLTNTPTQERGISLRKVFQFCQAILIPSLYHHTHETYFTHLYSAH